MPREIKNLKEFMTLCARKDARYLKIKKPAKTAPKNKSATKLKVRCSRFLYTFTVADKKRTDRILKSIHANLKRIVVSKKTPSGKRVKTATPAAAAPAGKKKATA
jgi:large subunit ribosomal protein L38e